MKRNMMKIGLLAGAVIALIVHAQGFAGTASMSSESDLRTVKKEIEGGANINGRYFCNPQLGCKTYLSRAAFNGEVEALKYLLKKRAKVNDIGFLNHTSLALAAARGHLEAVEALLAAGADPNIEINVQGEKFKAIDAARKEGGQATDPAVKERYEKIIKLLEK